MTTQAPDAPAGLCERLRRRLPNEGVTIKRAAALNNPDGPEAAAAIERLVAENERMREALKELLAHDEQDAGCVPTDAHLDAQEAARTALEGASDDR